LQNGRLLGVFRPFAENIGATCAVPEHYVYAGANGRAINMLVAI